MRTRSLTLPLIACLLTLPTAAFATGNKKKATADHECANLKAEVLKATQSLTKLRDNTRALQDRIARAERERDQLAARLESAGKRDSARSKEIVELKRLHSVAITEFKTALAEAEQAQVKLRAKQVESAELTTKLRKENEMLAGELKAAWGRAKSAEARNRQLGAIEKDKAELLAQLKKIQAQSEEEIATLRTKLEREITVASEEIKSLQSQLASAKTELEKAISRPHPGTKKLEVALASSRRQITELESKLKTALAQLAKEGAAKADCEKRVTELKKHLAEAERNAASLRNQLARETSARKSLEVRVAALEKHAARPAPAPKSPPAPKAHPAPKGADLVAVLYFGNRCCTTKRDRELAIERVRQLLRKAPGTQFDIVGHTCNTGCPQANLCLSKCRAQYVRDTLVVAGIPPRILDTYGLGEEEPIADNRNEGGRRKNRRVEIKIYRPGALPPGY